MKKSLMENFIFCAVVMKNGTFSLTGSVYTHRVIYTQNVRTESSTLKNGLGTQFILQTVQWPGD